VANDSFAYVTDKIIEGSCFLFASNEFASQLGVIALVGLPKRRFGSFGDCVHFLDLTGPTRAIVPFHMQCIDELTCLSRVQFSSVADGRISCNKARQETRH
jgi:hypothetical protein